MFLRLIDCETVCDAPRRAAANYALLGWWLIPLHTSRLAACSCGRPGCTEPGRHPRVQSGPCEASRDQAVVRRWWTRWPDANIGLVLKPSNVLAVETAEDPRMAQDYRTLPATARILAPGRRSTLLYLRPPGMPARTTGLPGGMIVRAEGFIVLPPSQLDGPCCWLLESDPEPTVAPLPDWIARLLLAGPATPGEAPGARGDAGATEEKRVEGPASPDPKEPQYVEQHSWDLLARQGSIPLDPEQGAPVSQAGR